MSDEDRTCYTYKLLILCAAKKKLTLLSRSFFDRLSTINKCFSAETVEDIIKAFVRVQHSQLLILLYAVKSPLVL